MILIVGCARSGTTLTTGVIGACGANLGDVDKLNEIRAIRNKIIKPYLARLGVDPKGQHPLADPENLKPYPQFCQHITAAMGGADVYKCPKSAPIWPLWAEHFPDARVIIVRRDKAGIIGSCKRCRFMNSAPDWSAWVDHHVTCMEQMKETMNCFEVWPSEAIGNPEGFRPMVEWLGLEWNDQAVKSLIRPSLWHG